MTRSTLLNAYFGQFGGQYVPDKLLPVLDQLEATYVQALSDPEFFRELNDLRANFLGRPTRLPSVQTCCLHSRRAVVGCVFFLNEKILFMVVRIKETRYWLSTDRETAR